MCDGIYWSNSAKVFGLSLYKLPSRPTTKNECSSSCWGYSDGRKWERSITDPVGLCLTFVEIHRSDV